VGHPGVVTTTSYSPDGRTILTSGGDGAVRLWDAGRLRPLGEPLHVADNLARQPVFTPDGTQILALDRTGRVTTWDATPGSWLRRACSVVDRDFTAQERALYSISSTSPRPCP
jgi:WD40 repeat protein